MDYIIEKLNSYVNISDEKSVERQTLLRERIEYMLFMALGVLWNKNLNIISVEKRKEIVESLVKISIGQVVSAIRTFDINNEILSKKQLKVLDKYPELRNQALGHGYTHADKEGELEDALVDMYNELIKMDFFRLPYDIIEITSTQKDSYEGLRFSAKESGKPYKWFCPKRKLGESICENDVLLQGESSYFRMSPFIHIFDKGESIFVFQSLEDKLSGKVKLNRLLKSEQKSINVEELILLSYDSERRRISSNGTIMNYFARNYKNYISMPIESIIKDFLLKNRSNVQATIWGHGGVGKTACIQNVCMELFNDLSSKFSYIIFVSAKDRKYDTATGQICSIDGIRTYEDILDSVISVVFDKEYKEEICFKENIVTDLTNKTLIVIDDYETFGNDEKEKIQRFINGLNIDFFKVIITTRNKRFSSGIEIKMDEYSIDETKNFIQMVFDKEYRIFSTDIRRVLEDSSVLSKIYEATSGRALFLYQFAILYAQKGLREDDLKELKQSNNAREFLYGRMYDYLGEVAQKEFKVISQIADENNLIFKQEIMSFLLNEVEAYDLEEGLQELVEQKIIEEYDAENFRVYAKDMIQRMEDLFNQSEDTFKDHIKNRLHIIGGKKIKGTVYEAMLEEANLSRFKGNVRDTIQRYRQILNDAKCEKHIKKKALLNLTSYISINLVDNEQTIKTFDDYIEKLDFLNDVEVVKMYVQYLWRSDDVAKEKACDVLDRFFRKKIHKKTTKQNMELFAIATHYLCHNVLENTPEKVKSSAENRIMNEYCVELYDYISQENFRDYKPAIRHNVSLAMVATAKVAMDLSSRGYDKSDLVKKISEFGAKNFDVIFKNQLNKIINSDHGYSLSQIIKVRVTYIARYGLLVETEDGRRAIIHNTEMTYQQRQEIIKEKTIRAKIIGQNEKGYILSTKGIDWHNK